MEGTVAYGAMILANGSYQPTIELTFSSGQTLIYEMNGTVATGEEAKELAETVNDILSGPKIGTRRFDASGKLEADA